MQLLSSHYEGTPLDKSKGYTIGSPYKLNGSMICGKASVYSFVAELRNWMPADIGCVLWLAPQWSDIQPFIPWYAGTVSVPSAYARPDYPKSFNDHYHPPKDIRVPNDQHAFWTFVAFSAYMNQHYGEKIEAVKKGRDKIEKILLKKQKKIERKALKKYQKDPESARAYLTGYTGKLAEFTYQYTAKQIKK
jgi:dipeptidase